MVNERGGRKLEKQMGTHWFTTTLSRSRLMHDWPIASHIILLKSTTAHDMR